MDETQQIGGSFKVRGVRELFREKRVRNPGAPLVTFSSGSHGIAVALLARHYRKSPIVVMPTWAERDKVRTIKRLGGKVILRGSDSAKCEKATRVIAAERGAILLHPFRSRRQIKGYMSLWADIHQSFPDGVDVVLPVGSGGLMTAGLMYRRRTNAKYYIVGVEPGSCASYSLAISMRRPVEVQTRSLAAPALNVNCVPKEWFDWAKSPDGCEIVQVSDEEICMAKKLLDDFGLVFDPAVSAGFAYILFRNRIGKYRETALILTGRGAKITHRDLRAVGITETMWQEVSRDYAALLQKVAAGQLALQAPALQSRRAE